MIKKLKITVLGETYDVTVEEVGDTESAPVEVASKDMTKPPLYADPKPVIEVKAPISGAICEIPVKVGDDVKSGDCLCIIEVMKMKNTIPAPKDGVVTGIFVRTGTTVEADTLLLTME